ILSFALLGIGIGGALYGRPTNNRPALSTFAVTCLLEALAVAAPFALGDRLAVAALMLSRLSAFGFAGRVLGWSAIAAVTVFPAALVAGYQFPLLIALLGKGRREIGRQIGLTYAWNTVGSMAGSLAGGFGLLPLLGAPALWRFTAALLALLGAAAVALGLRAPGPRLRAIAAPAVLLVPTLALLGALGPTAAWRHSGIGAGRIHPEVLATPGSVEDFFNAQRRALVFEAEGVESSVALSSVNAYSLVVNGKSDGNVRGDASTMVMGGLLGALFHPGTPKRGLIIGLGTGSSAGWLSEVPSMERVDVVELERAVEEAAVRCEPISRWSRGKPRTTLTVTDAREVVLTTRERYDVIMAEPSNPYRAGVASLFTLEYFRAVSGLMGDGALLAQWIQAYEVDARTIRTIYATMGEVFPWVETWEVGPGDIILLAANRPLRHDLSRLRERIAQEPYRTALFDTWRADTVESVLGHQLAGAAFARAMHQAHEELNTDDRTVLEFGFGRQIGEAGNFSPQAVLALAATRGEQRPDLDGAPDWNEVALARAAYQAYQVRIDPRPSLPPGLRVAFEPWARYLQGDFRGAASAWHGLGREPKSAAELSAAAELLAIAGDEQATPVLDRLRERAPVDAGILTAYLRQAQGKPEEAARALEQALLAARTDPWATRRLMEGALDLAGAISRQAAATTPGLLRAVEQPFAVGLADEKRALTRVELAERSGDPAACLGALGALEPYPPRSAPLLAFRLACYRRAGDARAGAAQRDLEGVLGRVPMPLDDGLTPTDR
ncbi:MAG TPA: spermidine synthase, partial [Myxococcaceae bacterium]